MTDHISGAEAKQYRGGWWLLLIVGVLSVVAGVIILFKPSESLPTLAVIAGIFLLLDGILELVDSFMRSTPNRGLVALIGVLSAIVGVLLIRHPIGGVAAVALLIGIWLIAVGVIRFVTAFEEYENRGMARPGGNHRGDRRRRDRRQSGHRFRDPGALGRARIHLQRDRDARAGVEPRHGMRREGASP